MPDTVFDWTAAARFPCYLSMVGTAAGVVAGKPFPKSPTKR